MRPGAEYIRSSRWHFHGRVFKSRQLLSLPYADDKKTKARKQI
jgi:hypothetical protein